MKKRIIIDSDAEAPVKEIKRNVFKQDTFKLSINKLFEWFIYMIGYAVVLVSVSYIFKSFNINMSYFGLFAFLGAVIIYILNLTVKPLISYLTLPLTVLTCGLMYPLTNVIILYLTSLILGRDNFYIGSISSAFLIAIVISLFNILMEGLIIKPITKGGQ